MIKPVCDWLSEVRPPDNSSEQLVLDLSLVVEELFETIEGCESKVRAELARIILNKNTNLINKLNNRERNLTEIRDGLADTYVTLGNVAYDLDITEDDFEKVMKSNWTKFCNTEEEAQETVDLYMTGQHPDKPGEKIETYYEKGKNKYIVRKKNGKIMKSYLYKPVKL